MITFPEPIPFTEAVDKLDAKDFLPTELNTAEMRRHTSADLRNRGFFSSRVTDAHILQEFKNSSLEIVRGKSTYPQQRLRLKQLLAKIDYRPQPGKEGTLEDLSSNVRLMVMLKTNVSLVRSFGQWQQRNRPGELKAFPALELIRVSPRIKKRAWIDRWNAARDALSDLTTATEASGSEEDDANGINAFAMKNDPIWIKISRFGLPYEPFDFNSGMGTRAVGYREAVSVGVMKADDQPREPKPRRLNDGLEFSTAGLDDDLVKVLQDDLSDDVAMVDGVLRFSNNSCENLRARAAGVLSFLNAFDPNEPRDDHGEWARTWTTSDKMADAFNRFRGGATAKRERPRPYRAVSSVEAERIKVATGLDVSGYAHAAAEGDIKHVAYQHGNPVTEAKRGLIAITASDIRQLPRIFSRASVIARTQSQRTPHDRIRFERTIDGILTVVEEVRPRSRQLVLVSMYKRKLGSKRLQHLENVLPGSCARGGSQTSETYRQVTQVRLLRDRGQAVLRFLQEATCT